MGGFIVYTCHPDFPTRIPGILAAEGWEVRSDTDRLKKSRSQNSLFAYEISDGRSILELHGAVEADARIYFYLIPRWGWSWSPRLSGNRQRWWKQVEATLLKEGARIVTSAELEELHRSASP